MWLRSMISSSLRTCTAGHAELNDNWYVRLCGISCFERTQSKTTSRRMQRKEVEKRAFNLHFCFTTNQQPKTGLSSKLQLFCRLINKPCVHPADLAVPPVSYVMYAALCGGSGRKRRDRNRAHPANLATSTRHFWFDPCALGKEGSEIKAAGTSQLGNIPPHESRLSDLGTVLSF